MKKLFTQQLVCASVLLLAVTSGVLPGATRTIIKVASTVPANGDLNPYGVALVPMTMGNLQAGHILVSNFNNSLNLQGTGSTIMDIAPNGTVNVFAQIGASDCPGGIGLTTALVVLKAGYVIVGSLPTTDGTSATAQAGCLLVLNSGGTVVGTFVNAMINGPWDMTALDGGTTASLFVTNVLNGTVAGNGSVVDQGTVIRIDLSILANALPAIQSITVIGSNFPERTDPNALVIGPTGVALSQDLTLYVADSLNNRIAAIPHAVSRNSSAGIGTTLLSGGSLNDPLGLTILKDNIFAVNGNNGLLLNISTDGTLLGQRLLDASGMPPGAGALFGVATAVRGLYFVDDATNTLNLLPNN
jgi:hypothetical protein